MTKKMHSITNFLLMMAITMVIVMITWFAASRVSSKATTRIHAYVSDYYMKEASQDALKGLELLQEEDAGIYREWNDQEKAQVKEYWQVSHTVDRVLSLACGTVFALLLLIIWLFILLPGFFSKNPIINSGFVIGGLMGELIVHLFALKTNYTVLRIVLALSASLIIYCYYHTFDHTHKLKKQRLLYMLRQCSIIGTLSVICAVLAWNLFGMFLEIVRAPINLTEVGNKYVAGVSFLVMAAIVYGMAWRIHSVVISSALVNAINVMLLGLVIFSMLTMQGQHENLKLGDIVLGRFGYLLILVILLLGTPILTYCIYKLCRYCGWKTWDI